MGKRRPAWREVVDGRRPANVYRWHVRVRYGELDPLGHVNNAVYLTYLEQAAIDHAEAAGWGAARMAEIGGVFVARRHEIDYLRPAVEGDVLRVVTWAVQLDGARAVRGYEIARVAAVELQASMAADGLLAPLDVEPLGDVLVRARTVWAFVDRATGRPRRVPVGVREGFQVVVDGDETIEGP